MLSSLYLTITLFGSHRRVDRRSLEQQPLGVQETPRARNAGARLPAGHLSAALRSDAPGPQETPPGGAATQGRAVPRSQLNACGLNAFDLAVLLGHSQQPRRESILRVEKLAQLRLACGGYLAYGPSRFEFQITGKGREALEAENQS